MVKDWCDDDRAPLKKEDVHRDYVTNVDYATNVDAAYYLYDVKYDATIQDTVTCDEDEEDNVEVYDNNTEAEPTGKKSYAYF
jgi:hypothetical protein